MTRLLDGVFSQGFETLRQLAIHPKFTSQLGNLIRRPGGVDRALRALHEEFFPVAADSPAEKAGPKLVHGLWTPLADKAEMVKRWPGIDPAEVDAAIQAAHDDGTIAGYEREVAENPLLDLVIVVNRESVPATLIYFHARAKEAWEGELWGGAPFFEEDIHWWSVAYDESVDDDRVKLLKGARPFVPNRITVECVDFGANWKPGEFIFLEEVQKEQADQLADFAVPYNAVQSPAWIMQMNPERVPCAIAAAILLNMPGYVEWCQSPNVGGYRDMLHLTSVTSGSNCSMAMPLRRNYPR